MRVQRDLGGVGGTVLYEATAPDGSPIPGPRAAVLARMHGNEPLGDPVLERLAEAAPDLLVAGSVLTIRVNERAAAANRRHTPEGSDLNRLWDAATLERLATMPREAMSYEEERAFLVAPLLATADAILDLHSTSRPAAPFLVLRDDQAHAALALGLGVRNLVTGVHENGVLSGGMAANLGLWPGEQGRRIGFVFEAGQHTDPANGARAWEVTQRFLAGLGVFRTVLPPTEVQAQIYEITDRFVQPAEGEEQYRFVGFVGGEEGGGRRGLPPRLLHSFEEIQADEVILRRGRSEVLRAESPFTMLMPAPTTPPGTDLYYVAQSRHGGLTLGEPRSDLDARREALAIERMMDLVADDEFERGATWVAFDTRRLFDLCASLVARQSRLPPGDPDRRITVVGRGDHGLDEADRRAGQRYRHAMRTAILDGTGVERIQLLRGAPLAWLDSLTGPAMAEMLARRADRTGSEGGVTMRFSLTHPHTVSLLVGGDLDRAIATGDTRRVRVVLLIEAAFVEADGPAAKVRIVRSGLVSARREVLLAAARMIAALRKDHQWLLTAGPLRGSPGVLPLSGPDGVLHATADTVRMFALRDALRGVQWKSWVDLLRAEVVDGTVLAGPLDRGRWLARTMSATGILDPDALAALLLRPDGAGSVVTTAMLEGEPPEDEGPEGPSVAENRSLASVPALFAREVTADDLERWVGFVRFVRSVQVVPDTRGKDLDLAFDSAGIRARLTKWYRAALRLGAERPGKVVVVVAGDGMRPGPGSSALYDAHRALLTDENVAYVRIQHAQTASLAWLKDLAVALAERPPQSAPASVRFEVEHGSTVNVVLVLEATWEGEDPGPGLDRYEARATAVVLSDLGSVGSHAEEVGLFTERFDDRSWCRELVAFARAHTERMLVQVEPVSAGGLEAAVQAQIARWIERVRGFRPIRATLPADRAGRARWVAHRFGLTDPLLADALAGTLDDDTDAATAAAELWRAVPSWSEAARSAAAPAPDRSGT